MLQVKDKSQELQKESELVLWVVVTKVVQKCQHHNHQPDLKAEVLIGLLLQNVFQLAKQIQLKSKKEQDFGEGLITMVMVIAP